MLKRFADIHAQVQRGGRRTLAIPAGDDEGSIEAAVDALKKGLAGSILLGDAGKIREGLRKFGAKEADFEIVDQPDYGLCAATAVRMVREKRADMILKGHLDTSLLLKAALDKDAGLRTDRLLSDVFVFEDPLWDDRGGKLTAITDGGITPAPTLDQKRQILENAVEVFHKLGYVKPKVAVMSGTEKVSDKIPSTTDAQALQELNRKGGIKGCVVEGPMALDVAALKACAEMKGIRSEIAGAVDIMVMPNFEAGNMVAKTFVFYMKRAIGHVIVGAKAPILINSRSDDPALKLNSIALSVFVSLPGPA